MTSERGKRFDCREIIAQLQASVLICPRDDLDFRGQLVRTMHRALTFVVLAPLFLAFRAFPQQAPTTGDIEGIVIRSDTGQPIANAQVKAISVRESSDSGVDVKLIPSP
jgi:hypothetical protein